MKNLTKIQKFCLVASLLFISVSGFAQWNTGTGIIYTIDNKVGIGINSPISKLHVEWNNTAPLGEQYRAAISGINTSTETTFKNGIGVYGKSSGESGAGVYGYNANSGSGVYGISTGTGAGIYGYNNNANGYGGYFIGRGYFSGSVGIGCSNINPYVKLAVNGKIRANEVEIIQNPCSVPDYVFESNFKLLSLKELENYVQSNKHLPEVPSAKEFSNGYNIGDMDNLLLKKIEELTLYIIEQNKRIEALENTTNKEPQISKQ